MKCPKCGQEVSIDIHSPQLFSDLSKKEVRSMDVAFCWNEDCSWACDKNDEDWELVQKEAEE